jgi:hypothetical protein
MLDEQRKGGPVSKYGLFNQVWRHITHQRFLPVAATLSQK